MSSPRNHNKQAGHNNRDSMLKYEVETQVYFNSLAGPDIYTGLREAVEQIRLRPDDNCNYGLHRKYAKNMNLNIFHVHTNKFRIMSNNFEINKQLSQTD